MKPERKKITILSIGTRGDVQPCLLLGRALQEAGYVITIVATAEHDEFIKAEGFNFSSLNFTIREMHAAMRPKTGRKGSGMGAPRGTQQIPGSRPGTPLYRVRQ